MIDKLTGKPYETEHARYVRLYGLTGAQASGVMLCDNEDERAEACFRCVDINARRRWLLGAPVDKSVDN
jgi:hypothetical protein